MQQLECTDIFQKIQNVIKFSSANQLRQKVYWRKGHSVFTTIPNFDSIGWVILEIQIPEIRTFFLNHFSGRFTPFWVSWHENLDFFFLKNKASFMRKQNESKLVTFWLQNWTLSLVTLKWSSSDSRVIWLVDNRLPTLIWLWPVRDSWLI